MKTFFFIIRQPQNTLEADDQFTLGDDEMCSEILLRILEAARGELFIVWRKFNKNLFF